MWAGEDTWEERTSKRHCSITKASTRRLSLRLKRRWKWPSTRFGFLHEKTFRALLNLAEIHVLLKHYDQAEQLYKKALALVEETNGDQSERMAIVLGKMAVLYQQQKPAR